MQRFSSANLAREHLFVSWVAFSPSSFRSAKRRADARGRQLFVSVEPFTRRGKGRSAGRTLFSEILRGGYDREIQNVCGTFGSVNGPMVVRWGHEMDDRSDRYPWAQPDAAGYIAAYRYFVTRCRALAPKARFAWSPMGESGLHRYFPGSAYVDYVGIPVWALQGWDIYRYGRARSFDEILGEKYRRVAKYGKPIVVAEFGISGRADYRNAIISGMPGAKRRFPLLDSILYFNMREPHHWQGGFGSPDWRIDPALFQQASG